MEQGEIHKLDSAAPELFESLRNPSTREGALAALYNNENLKMLYSTYDKVGDWPTAEELVGEAWRKFIEQLDTLTNPRPVALLKIILKNLVRDYWRLKKVNQRRSVELDDRLEEEVQDPQALVEDAGDRTHWPERTEEYLRRLAEVVGQQAPNERYRIMTALIEKGEDLSPAVVQKLFGLKREAAKVLLFRYRNLLRNKAPELINDLRRYTPLVIKNSSDHEGATPVVAKPAHSATSESHVPLQDQTLSAISDNTPGGPIAPVEPKLVTDRPRETPLSERVFLDSHFSVNQLYPLLSGGTRPLARVRKLTRAGIPVTTNPFELPPKKEFYIEKKADIVRLAQHVIGDTKDQEKMEMLIRQLKIF